MLFDFSCVRFYCMHLGTVENEGSPSMCFRRIQQSLVIDVVDYAPSALLAPAAYIWISNEGQLLLLLVHGGPSLVGFWVFGLFASAFMWQDACSPLAVKCVQHVNIYARAFD